MRRFILDFYCPELKLAIELDGSQHRTPWGAEFDGARSAALARLGIQVLRLPNEILIRDPESVATWLEAEIAKRRAAMGR